MDDGQAMRMRTMPAIWIDVIPAQASGPRESAGQNPRASGQSLRDSERESGGRAERAGVGGIGENSNLRHKDGPTS